MDASMRRAAYANYAGVFDALTGKGDVEEVNPPHDSENMVLTFCPPGQAVREADFAIAWTPGNSAGGQGNAFTWIRYCLRYTLVVIAALVFGLTSSTAALASATAPAATSAQTLVVPKDAYTAYGRWKAKDWPEERKWYTINGKHCYAGGKFENREGLLPAGGDYYEYDIYCYTSVPPPGGRGPKRIVVDMKFAPPRGYYTPDHYRTFQRM
ncbi:ribonuclease domain-containing protein [Actinosynnema sp. CA-299493]